MNSETFKASVQYNDLLGSSAADMADVGDAIAWLKQRGHLGHGDFLLGVEAYISPSILPKDSDISVSASFIIVQADSFELAANAAKASEPAAARKVTLDMTCKDFFSLFKRFNVTLSSSGVLEGREYVVQ